LLVCVGLCASNIARLLHFCGQTCNRHRLAEKKWRTIRCYPRGATALEAPPAFLLLLAAPCLTDDGATCFELAILSTLPTVRAPADTIALGLTRLGSTLPATGADKPPPPVFGPLTAHSLPFIATLCLHADRSLFLTLAVRPCFFILASLFEWFVDLNGCKEWRVISGRPHTDLSD